LQSLPFDPEAEAVILRKDAIVFPDEEREMITRHRVMKSPAFNIDIRQDQALGKIVFTMKSLPGLPEEPYMDAVNDYLQRVELQLSYSGGGLERNRYVSTWEEATRKLLSDDNFGIHLDRDIPGASDIVKAAKLIPDEKSRMNYVYRAVYGHMRWNGYFGIYTTENLRQAWDHRNGNVAEMNLVLVNVLRSAGIFADPLLVSERKNGRVNTQQAFLTQFNKVIACVSVGDHYYYLDLTRPQPSIELVPWELLNTTGYLVHKKSSRFLFIQDDVHARQRAVNIICKISNGGEISGEALVIDHGYLRMASREDIRRDKSGYVDRQFQQPYPGIIVDSFSVQHLEEDSLPLEQQIRYHGMVNQQSEYLMLRPSMFLGMESNPFLSPNRYTDINFGSRRKLTCNASLQLLEGVAVDALPKDITFIMPDTSIVFRRMTAPSQDGKTVITRVSIEFRKTVFQASEYPSLSAFYKKMYGLLEEPVLLKRSRP
jgi:hypothetical protein